MGLEQLNFNGQTKEAVAIERLRAHEPAEGYYLAFSGGKDSVVILRLAQIAGVRFDAHYQITTVDPPELVQFIKREYPNVERHHPEKSMWELMIQNQFPPMRTRRYCCAELKEMGGRGRVVVTGVRWAESPRRKNRRMVEGCNKDVHKSYLHPIIDWSNQEVWQFIRQYEISYCSLYDEGFKRLGCVLCPMTGYKGMVRDITRWPRIAAQYLRTFEKILAIRQATGKKKLVSKQRRRCLSGGYSGSGQQNTRTKW